MSKSPNPDIIDKIYFRNIYSCQRKIYWYKVKVMETINAVWEHSYGEDCIPNFSANMEQPRHRWYEFKEGFSLTLVERAIRETKKDNKSTSFTVLDPFSGSGTSPLTALQSRCNAIGYEVNPFMSFVGKTKCQQRTKSIHDYTKELNRILVQRPFRLKSPLEGVSTFTGSGENGKWLFNLDVLRAYEALYQHISLSEYKDFFLLALITSAMQCCNAKKDGKCLRYLKNWKALNYTGANLRDTFKANALQMNEVFTSECAFIIVDSNLYLIEPYEADYSGRDHICYQYNAPQNESLTIKDKQFQLSEYYDSAITSIFAQPTYKELDEAMDYYNTRYVRDSSCAVLSQIWTDEAKREFVQKPEHFMRDSLWQCLQNILRNHTVKREQIVDATHPVDIKVTWPAINNVALIEVKWLGDSGQTQYRDARANEGAKQLIDYLASSVQEEPDKHFVGYLTVFDGRRGKTSNQYERQEINYRSEYSSHPSMNYRRFYMAECV